MGDRSIGRVGVAALAVAGLVLGLVACDPSGDDPSWANGSVVLVTDQVQTLRSWSTLTLPGGRLATVANVGVHDAILAVQRADGSADPSFSGDGYVELPRNGNSMKSVQVLPTTGGRLLVLIARAPQPVVARYLADGTLDTSWAGDGTLELSIPNAVAAVGVTDTDGSLVVATGDLTAPSLEQTVTIARVSTDAEIVAQGEVVDDDTGANVPEQLAIDSKHRVVVLTTGVSVAAPTISRHRLARVNSVLGPDRGFAGGRTLLVASNIQLPRLAISSGNRPIVVGARGGAATVAVRATTSGKLDTSYGPRGAVTVAAPKNWPAGTRVKVQAVAADAGGGLLLAGYLAIDGQAGGNASLTRLTSTGKPDPGVDHDGTRVWGSDEVAEWAALSVAPDGKASLAGGANLSAVSTRVLGTPPPS